MNKLVQGHPFVNKVINWFLGALFTRWKSEGYKGEGEGDKITTSTLLFFWLNSL